jgi:SnoaL-like domain
VSKNLESSVSSRRTVARRRRAGRRPIVEGVDTIRVDQDLGRPHRPRVDRPGGDGERLARGIAQPRSHDWHKDRCEKVDVWTRSTAVFRKEGGAWKVMHVHSSVPFYMDGSLKAAVDLKPATAA